jgi:hypothetical protein
VASALHGGAGVLIALLLAGTLLVDRVVAVVDRRPLMLSEVRVLAEVRGLDEPTAREELIDERLMFQEAARLPQAAVSDGEESAAVAPLLQRHLAAPEDELRRLARRQLSILKYVQMRFRPQVRVTDEEVQAEWEHLYASRPDAPALPDVAAALTESLAARKLDERIEEWVKELRQSAEVRVNP